jgi:malonyl-CoA O-methyltransferase
MNADASMRYDRPPPPPAVDRGQAMLPIALLHGWGSDSRVLDGLAQRLSVYTPVFNLDLPGFGAARDRAFPVVPEAIVRDVLPRIPDGAVLVGWSLGGAIATLIAEAAPERIAALVCIASNPCFVQRDDWKHGMDRERFAEFREGLRRDSAALLLRFALLQAHGEKASREIARELRDAASDCASDTDLLAALDMLAALDVRAAQAALDMPVLHILGGRDALVSRGAIEYCRDAGARFSVQVVESAGHAPFLSAEAAVAARIEDFIRVRCTHVSPALRDKRVVARSFGMAASRYDAAAVLQRDVGHQLAARLPRRRARRILDIGCGTGAAFPALESHYEQAPLVALDIAENMLRTARSRNATAQWICADTESIPLADASIDVAHSNLTLQWCENLPRFFRELARILAPGGDALLSTLGPDTLWELRAAWRNVDRDVHVNRFADVESIRSAAAAAGLEAVAVEQQYRLRRYTDVFELGRELRQLGAHNLNQGRRSGLVGRAVWQQLQGEYSAISGAGGELPATYQVLYCRFRKHAS